MIGYNWAYQPIYNRGISNREMINRIQILYSNSWTVRYFCLVRLYFCCKLQFVIMTLIHESLFLKFFFCKKLREIWALGPKAYQAEGTVRREENFFVKVSKSHRKIKISTWYDCGTKTFIYCVLPITCRSYMEWF